LVESVEVEGLGHAQPVDPGPGTRQCGAVGPHMEDLDICAGQRIAEFWGIAVR